MTPLQHAAASPRTRVRRLPERGRYDREAIDAVLDAGLVAHLGFDHCFEGWRGAARIRDEKLSLKLTSSLPYLMVYTPDPANYFCVEPVSHVPNAIHMAEPSAHGLLSLGAGESTEAWMKIEVAPA